METRRRSALKSLSWRFVATFVTMVVAYAVSADTEIALKIGLLDTSVKFLTYFIHERLWLKIPYGRAPVPAPAPSRVEPD